MTTQYLSRDAILDAPDTPEKDVAVPQWGGSVRIKALTKAEHQELRKQATVTKPNSVDGKPETVVDDKRFDGLLFIHSVIQPRFAPDDLELIRGKGAAPVDTVIKAIAELNGWAEGAMTKAERAFPGEPDAPGGVPAGAGPGEDGGAAS